MIIECRDHIVGGHGLAVVEFHALAQVKHPGLRTIRWLIPFGKLRNQFAVIADLGEMVAAGVVDRLRHAVFRRTRVKRIRCGAIRRANPGFATLLGRCRKYIGRERQCRWNRKAGGNGCLDELAAVNLALAQPACLLFQIFVSHVSLRCVP